MVLVSEILRNALQPMLASCFGTRLKGISVFGSYARGDADNESDLDVLIVLDQIDHYASEVDRTSEIIGRLSLDYGISISRVFLSEKEWHHGDSPFVQNLREEAISA